MKKFITAIVDLVTMPFVSVAILIHESREEFKEERLDRKNRKSRKKQ